MIQDKPEPFRPLPCFFDGCKSKKKKLGFNAFPQDLLRSSLKFSDILSSYYRQPGIGGKKMTET